MLKKVAEMDRCINLANVEYEATLIRYVPDDPGTRKLVVDHPFLVIGKRYPIRNPSNRDQSIFMLRVESGKNKKLPGYASLYLTQAKAYRKKNEIWIPHSEPHWNTLCRILDISNNVIRVDNGRHVFLLSDFKKSLLRELDRNIKVKIRVGTNKNKWQHVTKFEEA